MPTGTSSPTSVAWCGISPTRSTSCPTSPTAGGPRYARRREAMADVVYLVTDLFFVAKIDETAAQLGVAAEQVRDAEALAARAPAARLALVDLRRPDALDALDRLRAAAPE